MKKVNSPFAWRLPTGRGRYYSKGHRGRHLRNPTGTSERLDERPEHIALNNP